MPRPKIVLLTPTKVGARTAAMISQAPADLEVICVDNGLPDEEKIPLCREAKAIIAIPPTISIHLLRNCPEVKLLQTIDAGYDNLDVEAISDLGIPIANNGGAYSIPVAEQTIALMLCVHRHIMAQWHNAVKEGRWREGLDHLDFGEITNKTVGIVGLGHIGKEVARLLRGFRTLTIYYEVADVPLKVQRELSARPVNLDELLRQSDIVTLHVPLTPATRGMIGDRELEMMKPTAYLVNTSRGPVVDEKALYRALTNRRIAGAGLDVLEQEPPDLANPLLQLDNMVITPHMASTSREANVRTAEFAYSNVKRVLAGEPPQSSITPR